MCLFIDKSDKELTFSDEYIEQAITLTNAKLFILDPLQSYLGPDVDMHRANSIHPVCKQLVLTAEPVDYAMKPPGFMERGQLTEQTSLPLAAKQADVVRNDGSHLNKNADKSQSYDLAASASTPPRRMHSPQVQCPVFATMRRSSII